LFITSSNSNVALALTEVMLFHAALGGLDGSIEPAMHEGLALLHPQLSITLPILPPPNNRIRSSSSET